MILRIYADIGCFCYYECIKMSMIILTIATMMAEIKTVITMKVKIAI
jgi:hypothetical protein